MIKLDSKTLKEVIAIRGVGHLDAATQLYLFRELEQLMPKTYDVLYPEYKARYLFPIDRTVPPGAKAFTYFQYDRVGLAKVIANYAKDFPRANVFKKTFTGYVKELGASYGYSEKDILSAQMAGLPLEAREAFAAKQSILSRENQIAFSGDADNNLGGFLSNANINTVVLAADGTGAARTFASKTAAQIIRDIHSLATTIVTISKGVERPDTLLLPPTQYSLLAGLPYSTLLPITVLDWLNEHSTYFKGSIIEVPELTGAGTLGTDIMVAYKKDPMKLGLIVTQDFTQMPPQLEGMEWTIPCWSGTGGVVIFYPLSVAVASGI
jgi:hypothetical protein